MAKQKKEMGKDLEEVLADYYLDIIDKDEAVEKISYMFDKVLLDLLGKAEQMKKEQESKLENNHPDFNYEEIGTLNGIDRIIGLIRRHYNLQG